MNARTIEPPKGIRKVPSTSGQFEVWGLRDLPGRPLEGGPYLAARTYDEYTADLLLSALKADAIRVLRGETACALPVAPLDPLPKGQVKLNADGPARRLHADEVKRLRRPPISPRQLIHLHPKKKAKRK